MVPRERGVIRGRAISFVGFGFEDSLVDAVSQSQDYGGQ
jgi:hypothetical protein